MQKNKPQPIEYLQSVLYHIKYHWLAIITAILIPATVILGLIYAVTNNKICYYCGVATGLIVLLLWGAVYANKISEQLGLWKAPEDEEV